MGDLTPGVPDAATLLRRRLQILCATLALALALGAGFYLGQRAAYSGLGIDPAAYRVMRSDLAALREALETREAEFQVQRTRHEVDRAALEMVRREIAAQKEEIAGLEEGLRFYRSLMAPGEIAQGITLRELELVQGRDDWHVVYRIVIQQEASKHEQVLGSLTAAVYGVLDGKSVEYPLAVLDSGIGDDAVPLRFRYFQALEGEMTLPRGFIPAGVRVDARIRAPHEVDVGQDFPWQLNKRFSPVGK